MDSESSLYQKVWGESDGDGRASESPLRSFEPDPLDAAVVYSSEPAQPSASRADGEGTRGDEPILQKVELIEQTISEIRRSEAESRQLLENGFAVLMEGLKSLESRISRLENGIVRSLEYLESRIESLGR